MKKNLVLGLILIFLLLIIFINNNSYAYVSCNNYVLHPKEINTFNLEEYLKSINYNEIKSFCSYDMCYEIKENIITNSINNFNKIYYKRLNDDELMIISVKGFPITKIVIDNC